MAKTEKTPATETEKLKQQVEELTKALKVAEATKPKNAKPIVNIDGVAYEVVGGEKTQKGDVSREDLAKDQKRCAELVAKGSGLLRKVNVK